MNDLAESIILWTGSVCSRRRSNERHLSAFSPSPKLPYLPQPQAYNCREAMLSSGKKEGGQARGPEEQGGGGRGGLVDTDSIAVKMCCNAMQGSVTAWYAQTEKHEQSV